MKAKVRWDHNGWQVYSGTWRKGQYNHGKYSTKAQALARAAELNRKNPMSKKTKKRKRHAKHRAKNPKPIGLFKTKAAARKYAKEHARPGVKFSIKKLKRGK